MFSALLNEILSLCYDFVFILATTELAAHLFLYQPLYLNLCNRVGNRIVGQSVEYFSQLNVFERFEFLTPTQNSGQYHILPAFLLRPNTSYEYHSGTNNFQK
jgi:hypothetical protein